MIMKTADLKSLFHNIMTFKENEPGYLDTFIYSECIKMLITDSLFLCAYCDKDTIAPVFEIRVTVFMHLHDKIK